jgi:RHS repeat-associated protein
VKLTKLWDLLLVFGAVGAVILTPRIYAQGPAQINEPHGDQPFGAYQVSDIDNIGFANGSVDVRIPLFSRPGRGLAHEKFWTYTSKAWFEQQTTTPCDPTITQCPPPTPAVWAYANSTDTLSQVQQYRSTTCHDGHMHSEWTNYTYMDRSGTPHVFDAVTATEIPAPNCIHPKIVGYSLDNSGMRLDTNTGIITFKDGSTAQGPTLFKDANGNSLTLANAPSTGEFDTLGRNVQHLTGTLPDGAQYEDWIAQDSAGNQQKTRIERIGVHVCTNFGQGDTIENCGSLGVTRKIDLPNGLAYQFTYDTGTTPGHYGELIRIDLPSGGYIRYEYAPISSAFSIYNTIRAITKRAVSADGTAASEKAWTYLYQLQTPDISHNTTLVTDPDGNQTAHVIQNTLLAIGSPAPLETETRFYQGSTSLLRTVRTEYSILVVNVGDSDDATVTARTLGRPIRVTTILDNGLTSKVETDYDPLPDTNGVISFSRSNVTERREYGYGQGTPGSMLRRTTYTYQHNTNSAYATANIVDKVLNTTVYDGAANIVAQSQNVYDGTTLTATATAPNHDYTNYGTGNALRGNLTAVKRWRNTDSTWLTTTYGYDDLGNVLSVTDPGSHVTNFSFSDNWSGASCVNPGVNTYAFVTQIKNHLNQRTQAAYYSCPGLVQSKRDENDIVAGRTGTTFTYDGMNRLLTTSYADGGQTSLNYHSDALPLTVTKTQLATPNPSIVSSVIYDGLGRVKTTSLDSDPAGADLTDTTYDNLGRKRTVSNPHRSTTSSTDGVTTYQYDALGRVTQGAPPDGTVPSQGSTCLANNVCTSSSGNSIIVTDQAGNQRRSFSDALGRLIEVDEPGDNYAGVNASGSLAISGALRSVGTPTSGSGSVTISGTEQTYTDFSNCVEGGGLEQCPTVWDTGAVSIIVNGKQKTAFFGQGDSAPSIATNLAGQFNADGTSPVSASISGSVITLRAKAAGAATNYSLSVAYSSQAGSFSGSASGANLTGGTDGGAIVYDAGNVQVSVGAFSTSVPYGQSTNSTSSAVASALTTALNVTGSPVTAGVSGSNITLTYKTASAAGNVAVSASSSTTQTTYFSGGSFCATSCTATLAGGQNPTGPSLDHNFYVTQYSYDTLGNMLTVTQMGDPSVNTSSQWRVRNFTYNSLSQLLTATNPESGTITYAYDADGNLLQKTSPAPNQTGTATQTVSYCYDELHRVTGKGYGAQSCPLATPVNTYSYDSGTNAVGHLTSLTDQVGSGSYGYDIMGRIVTETRSLIGANNASVSKSMSYGYDLAGAATTLTYPSGKIITYTPDSAGRMLKAIDIGSGINYITGATYGPDGALTGFVSGNSGTFAGITSAFSYNKRLQPVNMSAAAPSQTAFSIGYDFHVGAGNNGNVFGITNYKDLSRNQSFTYDSLNRLTSAQNAGTNCAATVIGGKTEYWGNSYGYDAWGNLLSKSVTKCSAENFSVAALGNNQLSGYSYDAAGNMTSDPTDGITLNYDPENRLTGAAGYTYTYDADGNRVKKSNSTTGTLYWYMTPGVVAESDLAGTLKSEYIFFEGDRVARKDFPGNTIAYYFSDHLKTASVVTDSAGTIKSESDYYPWGGELQLTANDSNHYKYGGHERDSETGCDYFGARYYCNGFSRFLSPDWSAVPVPVPYADFSNPQSLNQYIYVGGNPASKADPDGHCCDWAKQKLAQGQKWAAAHPRTMMAAKATVTGIATVGAVVAVVVTAPVSVPATLIAGATMMAAAGGAAATVTLATGAITGDTKGVNEAADAVQTISNPVGLAVAVGSGVDMDKAGKAAAVSDLLTGGKDALTHVDKDVAAAGKLATVAVHAGGAATAGPAAQSLATTPEMKENEKK